MQIQVREQYASMEPTRVDNTPMPQRQVQCSWCGVLMGGPLDGFYPTTPAGVVAILAGKHIVSDQCDQCFEVYNTVKL